VRVCGGVWCVCVCVCGVCGGISHGRVG
jgi:hypothetical protein